MTDLSIIAKNIGPATYDICADIQALEKSLAQSERERWLHDRSTDRIPELLAEGELLADKYQMDYAVVQGRDGVFALCAADASNRSEWVRYIKMRQS